MSITSVNQIRTAFLDFFSRNHHTVVPSAPLVPHNDPTLMFTNAGMVPFKHVFTGQETRDYVRAASSQKCVRAGGKHNDLDNVGYTARHHTFFEMLGNFSFGDYFKEDAIILAWDFLTKEIGLSREKLLVTVYHTDDEAASAWKRIADLPDEKIIRITTQDNFWAMGDTGPCGPCSEIFYDHGSDIAGGPPGSAEEDGDRFTEIWNLVFMQYEKLANGSQVDLPAPSIDTGMGLERLATVLQGVHDNYHTDLFQALIDASVDLTGDHNVTHAVSHRVIADHLRSCSFLLADGVMPSNEGRGYVLRRIMRRAMRHVHQIGCKEPLMYRLVPALIIQMGAAYPELSRAEPLITEMLKLEEERFQATLGRGLALLKDVSSTLSVGEKLDGGTAFKLYDTYGFPLDLTKDILRTRHIDVDEKGFDVAMDIQKARAKAAWKGSGEAAVEDIWFDIKNQHGATEFVGYDTLQSQGTIVALINKGKQVKKVQVGDDVFVVLNQTPFYGESGGQQGDAGILQAEGEGVKLEVVDTQKFVGDVHVHKAKIVSGTLRLGVTVDAIVDAKRRKGLRAHHSATHLLHAALRNVLGEHIAQKGSLVAPDRLRFDISHPKALTKEEIVAIESMVNEVIGTNTLVTTRLMSTDDAIAAGAVALFGEKYGDEVRVVTMGQVFGNKTPLYSEDVTPYSVELCGGTHVHQTGDIGFFKIVEESAIAAGVRRIEAVTGVAAFDYVCEVETQLHSIAQLLKVSPEDAFMRVEALVKDRKRLDKSLAEAKKALVLGGSNGGNQEEIKPENINGISVLCRHLEEVAPKDLRAIAGELLAKLGSGLVAVTSACEGKASLIITVSKDKTSNISAVDLVQKAAPLLGAKGGGGKPGFAQTGGADVSQLGAVFDVIKQHLQQ